MTALSFQRGIHGKPTGNIDCCLIEFGSQLRRHKETVTEDAVTTRERNSSRRQQSEGDKMPRSLVDPTMGKDLAIFGEIEFTLHEAVGELAGIDRKRADVTSNLFSIFFHSLAENHFKNSGSTLVRCTKN